MTDSTETDRKSSERDDPVLARDGRLATVALWGGAATALVAFLFTVQLLGTATEVVAPLIGRLLDRVVTGDASALGLSWLSTDVLTNGSVVAALSVSLFRSDVLTTSEADE